MPQIGRRVHIFHVLAGSMTAIAADANGRAEIPWLVEQPVKSAHLSNLIAPLDPPPNGRGSNDGGIAGVCPELTVTYSSHNFQNGPFTAQAGFVAQEIAAVSYTVPANHFPLRIDHVDGLFGTMNPQGGPITTHWSLIVWEGTPTNGTIVYAFSSDGINPPHMVMTPPTNGVVLQASVDPGDPDQIIVTNNGSSTFTVGFRIDQMNQPPTQSCNGGFTPAPCCLHNTQRNKFPTTDLGSVSQPSNNWLFARTDCGFGSLSGWYTFAQLAALKASPSGDWNIRATYTPQNCVILGACCLNNGASCQALTEIDCFLQNGVYRGNNTTCTSSACFGACCVPSTGNCVFTSSSNCTAVNGQFQGVATTCGTTVCFPIGACCLPNGSCLADQSPENCAAQGGAFQGNATSCASVNCPVPTGSCCVGTVCLDEVTEADCIAGFGGQWAGPNTLCNQPNVCSSCDADIAPQPDGDGVVDVNDLLLVVGNWGATGANPADINGDLVVNVNDLLAVVGAWGPCG